jgi:hypothetical protein
VEVRRAPYLGASLTRCPANRETDSGHPDLQKTGTNFILPRAPFPPGRDWPNPFLSIVTFGPRKVAAACWRNTVSTTFIVALMPLSGCTFCAHPLMKADFHFMFFSFFFFLFLFVFFIFFSVFPPPDKKAYSEIS